ncbi:MAG: zinc-binding dehydrogenase [Acidimicrobiales bacterium]
MSLPVDSLAMVLTAPRNIEVARFPLPQIGADDGLLRVEACGLCGTDHELYSGHLPTRRPVIPGHETVGIIEAVGEVAARRWDVAVGDRVALECFQSCGVCAACRGGAYRRCERHGTRTLYGMTSTEVQPSLLGGYAEYHYLAPDSMLLPVPDSLNAIDATLFNPIGAGIRWGADLPGTGPGDVVAVLGPGIRGLAAVAAAREAGAERILITGFGERDRPRLQAARDFGATVTVDAATEDPVAAIRELSGGEGASVVVDVTANAPAALGQAVRMAARGGRIVLAGVRNSDDTPGFRPDAIMYKELTIIGALGVDAPVYRRALRLLASDKYPFRDVPRRVEPLINAAELLATMAGETESVPPVHAVLVPE